TLTFPAPLSPVRCAILLVSRASNQICYSFQSILKNLGAELTTAEPSLSETAQVWTSLGPVQRGIAAKVVEAKPGLCEASGPKLGSGCGRIAMDALILWLVLGLLQTPSAIPVTLKHYTPLFENEEVRVGRVSLPAGESEGVHTHPYPRVLI